MDHALIVKTLRVIVRNATQIQYALNVKQVITNLKHYPLIIYNNN